MNPFLDWCFKHMFGTEESKPNLIGFLNLMLMPQSPIVDLEFMNNESLPVSRDHKGCVFDIICRDTNDDRFLIEVQTSQAVNIVERNIYYTCRLMDRMGKRGIYAYSKTVDPIRVNRVLVSWMLLLGDFQIHYVNITVYGTNYAKAVVYIGVDVYALCKIIIRGYAVNHPTFPELVIIFRE